MSVQSHPFDQITCLDSSIGTQVELPAALRKELQELGQLPSHGRSLVGRKERRKQARTTAKQGRNKRAGAQAQADDGRDSNRPTTSKRPAEERQAGSSSTKRQKQQQPASQPLAGPSTATAPADARSQRKTTALERLLAKQERLDNNGVDPQRKKTKQEQDEDREIEWLEAMLGMRSSAASKDKQRWRGEFEEDGLEG